MDCPATTRSSPATLKIAFRCDLREVRATVAAIHDFLAKQGWSADDLMSFDLALVEACNNAIKYAREPARALPVELEASSSATQVEFRLHDHTPGFDWPARIELPPPESESGRGLYLINAVMDYAGYFRGQNENMLILRRNRPAPEIRRPAMESPPT
ncbi:MAG: Protein serine/threonine phosphatase [Pedosphaera sp.]|nr:Protein serine/threonine phosphatase [Pedosphaera sp.]